MFKVWLKYLSLSCGILFCLISTVFVIDFVREIYFQYNSQTNPTIYFEIPTEAWFSIIMAFLFISVGVPMTITGLKKIDE